MVWNKILKSSELTCWKIRLRNDEENDTNLSLKTERPKYKWKQSELICFIIRFPNIGEDEPNRLMKELWTKI